MEMNLQLQDRRALVTGSNTGIGAGIARMLVEEGAKVFVHGRNAERAEKVAAEIGAAGALAADIATDEGADALREAASAALGGHIEILVNNAGGATSTGSSVKTALDIRISEWLEAYQINTLAAVRMIQRTVPMMIEAQWGRVVNISSSGGVQPPPRGADYNGAKAAINNLSVSFARSMPGCGVTFNTVSPGIIATPSLIPWARERYVKERGWGNVTDAELQRRIALEVHDLPAGRLGIEEDIAMVVCLLASPRSGYITGANYRVDGGQCRSVN
jgi:3-oxoacyl-[acyl-carrier protein] reductase